MKESVTNQPIRQFVAKVSDHHFAMVGAVIAASAAQAAALGEACMQISLDNQVDKLNWQDVTTRIAQMVHLKNSILAWCDKDAEAITQYIAVRDTGGEDLTARYLLCEGPPAVARLAINSAEILQRFRPLVFERVQDDLEIAIKLLVDAARTAMMLLESNLRLWPEPDILQKYEPVLANLENRLKRLTPISHIQR